MPWLGLKDSETVVPALIEDRETVYCPDCGNPMFPRGPFDDGRARHFVHKSASLGGSGGNCSYSVSESEIHKKWKSLALSAMKQRFDDIEVADLEVDLDVSDTLSLNDTRRADVLVTFEEEHLVFGDGIAIEVQYKNGDKDLDVVTNDYLSKNYSVFWASAGHFTTDRFLLDEFEGAFGPDSEIGFCPYHDEVDRGIYLDVLSEEFFEDEWASDKDPFAFCDHTFDGGFCVLCEIESIQHPTTGERVYSYELPESFRVEYDGKGHLIPHFRRCNHSWNYSETSPTAECAKCGIEVFGKGSKCEVYLGGSRHYRTSHCGFDWYLMPGRIVCRVCGEIYDGDDESFPSVV